LVLYDDWKEREKELSMKELRKRSITIRIIMQASFIVMLWEVGPSHSPCPHPPLKYTHGQ